MPQELDMLKETPSQTPGPYVHIGCVPAFTGIQGVYLQDLGSSPLREGARGERIRITGRVIDGSGTPLRDAMIEIWQADSSGLYNSPAETRGKADRNFDGWARQATDAETGAYAFETIKPGQVPMPDGRLQAPHIHFWIVARGINIGLLTRMYFADEERANESDPVLGRIELQVRVPTLIAQRSADGYEFDIHLQGPRETVFFDA